MLSKTKRLLIILVLPVFLIAQAGKNLTSGEVEVHLQNILIDLGDSIKGMNDHRGTSSIDFRFYELHRNQVIYLEEKYHELIRLYRLTVAAERLASAVHKKHDMGGAYRSGDPLSWEESGYPITDEPYEWVHYKTWPDSKLFKFDWDCDGKKKDIDRRHSGTLTLFIDIDGNGVPCGFEMLVDYNRNSYQILGKFFDPDRNGIFDKNDPWWSRAKIAVWSESGWNILSPADFQITGFRVNGHIEIESDCFGMGAYADNGYVEDVAYRECREAGWIPSDPVSDSHFRYVAYHPEGIISKNGDTKPSYGTVLGHF